MPLIVTIGIHTRFSALSLLWSGFSTHIPPTTTPAYNSKILSFSLSLAILLPSRLSIYPHIDREKDLHDV